MAHIVVGFFHVKVDLFDDKLALFVFLTGLVGPCIRPPNHCLATLAKYVAYTVQSSDQ